tara:strand:+ start:220 stop:516 length:297 start_codon:yes stop_codon:yes gene_type:complete
MIDIDKYTGHTEGEWIIQVLDDNLTWNIQTKSGEQLADMVIGKHHGNAQLMADAPLLLAEVKRLKAKLFEAELWVNNDSYTFENNIKELNDYAEEMEE